MPTDTSFPTAAQGGGLSQAVESLTHARLLHLEEQYGSPQLWNQLDPARVETMADWMLIHQSRRAWGDHPELTRPPQQALAKTAEHLAIHPFALLDIASEWLARQTFRRAHAPAIAVSQAPKSGMSNT